ncbi:hypothetical protein BDD12DRAFT_883505 [Trichophaea hybrida]|nr:hypothetical protein BDD12DRAFT_883505 [Trichophaea hybrida]
MTGGRKKDRLIIWGAGFDISKGELDEVLSTNNAQHLRRLVEILLSSLSGSLLRLLDRSQREFKLVVLKDIVQYFKPVAAELLSCETNADSSVVWDRRKPTLEDLIDLNDSLYWLMPFLEEIGERLRESAGSSTSPILNEQASVFLIGDSVSVPATSSYSGPKPALRDSVHNSQDPKSCSISPLNSPIRPFARSAQIPRLT